MLSKRLVYYNINQSCKSTVLTVRIKAVQASNIGNTEPSENSQGKGGDLRSKYYPTLTVVRKT